MDFSLRKPSLTAGRTLLTCSEKQFAPYAPKGVIVPRTGLIEEIMPRLGAELFMDSDSLYSVTQDGKVITKNQAREFAVKTWWDRCGRELAIAHRRDVADWKNMPGPGRRPKDPLAPRVEKAQRYAARDAARIALVSLWEELRKVFATQHPSSEILTIMAEDRELPRQHCQHRVSPKRAQLEALRHMMDLDGRVPLWNDLVDAKIIEADHTKLMESVTQAIYYHVEGGNASAIMGYAALAAALRTSNLTPEELAAEIRSVLSRHNFHSLQVIRDLYVRADPTK